MLSWKMFTWVMSSGRQAMWRSVWPRAVGGAAERLKPESSMRLRIGRESSAIAMCGRCTFITGVIKFRSMSGWARSREKAFQFGESQRSSVAMVGE